MVKLFVNIHHSYEPAKIHNLCLVKVQTGQEEASREFIFVWRIMLNWFKNQSRRVMLRKVMQFSIRNWRVILNFGHMLNYDISRITDVQLGLSSDIINGVRTNSVSVLEEKSGWQDVRRWLNTQKLCSEEDLIAAKSFTPLWCSGWNTTLKSCSVAA